MNWEWSKKRDWSKEDLLYARKRNVSNKGSHEHEHIIGAIYSVRMKRHVQYESLWGECLFYYLLELDRNTVRYYEQSVTVPYEKLTKDFVLMKKEHISDVLVFREGRRPHLFQIKGGDKLVEQSPSIFKACMKYAAERGWDYTIVHPKISIPLVIRNNIEFLINYLQPRFYYNDWLPELTYRLEHFKNIDIYRLAKSFEPKIDHRHILPIIYHLIATGMLKTDLTKKVDHTSFVTFGSVDEEISQLIEMEGKNIEIMQARD